MTVNPFVALIARGEADRTSLAGLALEQSRVIPADRLAFLHLARRATPDAPESAAFFTFLAEGEVLAGERLGAFAAACGVTEAQSAAYETLPGCQGYPAYVAWLALNAEPAEAVFALTANFAAWGGYCATIAEALRTRYGFKDEACAFFDFFAEPSPELDRLAHAALEAGGPNEPRADRYARLLQSYEDQFWATLSALTPTA
ncbi:transcriptional regulator [Streptomyces chartreusis]|uniref:transcriptional regulator n=1 Tax=Streptomyces chartreusis TaxID=1969 RepID=UPI002E81CD92|nr:transcriptional regulator [Streptomyces chartreusis]WUB16365.1 transcriptional regulator [Streptomyces chartreusis]